MACGFSSKSKYSKISSFPEAPSKTVFVLIPSRYLYNLPAANQAMLFFASPYIIFKPGACNFAAPFLNSTNDFACDKSKPTSNNSLFNLV